MPQFYQPWRSIGWDRELLQYSVPGGTATSKSTFIPVNCPGVLASPAGYGISAGCGIPAGCGLQQHPPFTPRAFYRRRLSPRPRSHGGYAPCIRLKESEFYSNTRMAAAPRRRVQKHCKRREGCPPLRGGGEGIPEGSGVVVCGCGCVCVLCVLFQHSLWYHGRICCPCRSVERIPILMSPFFIFCLHRLHTVRFVVVSSAWTFSKLVRLSSGLPMWTCTYCGLWCNQVVEVMVVASMAASRLNACWLLCSGVLLTSSAGPSSCATSFSSPSICLCGRRCVCLIVWGVVIWRLSSPCCIFVGSSRVWLLPYCMVPAIMVVFLCVPSLLFWPLSTIARSI